MQKLKKLKKGDKVAILSLSAAAPGRWPDVYQLGLDRVCNIFNLVPVEFSTTAKIGASFEERSADLIKAFKDPSIKAIITSIGGNDQIKYIKNLPPEPFVLNPKPFFGFSDNTHFANFLWLNGVPSYYGGALFTQFAMQGEMDDYTVSYLKYALFSSGEKELIEANAYNEIGIDWDRQGTLSERRIYEKNKGWFWSGSDDFNGVTWGGCLESIDDMLRHNIKIPTLEQFKNIVLLTETSEEIPSHDYVYRVYRALGERGILKNIKAVLVGRPKAWEFNNQKSFRERNLYHSEQHTTILNAVREYNKSISVVQNIDFGHTDPQIPLPYGMNIRGEARSKKIFVDF